MQPASPVIVRAITVGISDPHPLDERQIAHAVEVLGEARRRAVDLGYDVQTLRIATRPLLVDMLDSGDGELAAYAHRLQGWCDALQVAYLSLGPIPASDPAFPLDRIGVIPDLLVGNASLNAAVQLATAAHGPRTAAALPAAQAMAALAAHDGGMPNFRFAVTAMSEPGGAFFPQAYAMPDTWTLSLGLQSAGHVRHAIEGVTAEHSSGVAAIPLLSPAITRALSDLAAPVDAYAREIASDAEIEFEGIDLSPAPMGEDSIAAAFEAVGCGPFGAPGTLAIAAAMTAGIRAVTTQTCGYNGLMLPVLEDALLGRRCAEGHISAHALLAYSTVCGTGLDTVPLSGDIPAEHVAALLADVAILAARLHKPLSARLFLVPGKRAGEMTTFDSPYLTNTRIVSVT